MGPDDSWEFAVAPPHTAPGATSMLGYRTPAHAGTLHRGLPSSRLTFILSLDEGVESADTEAGLAAARPAPVVLGGLHLTTAFIRPARGQTGVQLAVHPLASRALFGRPSAELSVRDFDALAELGADARRLHEQLAEADGWPHAFRLVVEHLVTRIDERRQARLRPEVARAWHLLERRHGRIAVGDLAAEVALRRRQLGELFTREVGRSPKAVAGLMRFEHATDLLTAEVRRRERPALGRVAARAGYADQAHLTRDFTGRTGVPPRQWIAEERRNIQDGSRPAAEG
ncbi:helix-turn-helix domain-containing protein [Nocardioides insulae]|uniref:helix-turn-helix domain-containing protein n=1 Tax=Nocardioides insulae TaxID=394734 RepID=UPI0004016364|nr:helix-turn-helix domain-containing protein [Nocardioides insulae]